VSELTEEEREAVERLREKARQQREELAPIARDVAPEPVEEDKEEEEEEEKSPPLTQEEDAEYRNALRLRTAQPVGLSPGAQATLLPTATADTLRALETKKREEELSDTDRKAARWKRHADANVKWPDEIEVLAEALGASPEAFGTSQAPGKAAYEAVKAAKENPEDETLRHAMMYFSNDLNITNQYPLTEGNYEEKLRSLALKDGLDLLRIQANAQSLDDIGIVGGSVSGPTVFIRRESPQFTAATFENEFRELAAETESIVTKKDFRLTAKDFADLIEIPEVVFKYTNGDMERVQRALRHGQVAAAQLEANGGLASASYTPINDRYGTSVDYDTMKLVAYLRTRRRLMEEAGEEPDSAAVLADLEPALNELETELRNAGLPIYDPDPMKTAEKLMRFAGTMEEASEAVRRPTEEFLKHALNLPQKAAKQATGVELPDFPWTDFLAGETGKLVGFPPKLLSGIAQQLAPVEAKSGYVTLDGEEIRVAHDRFAESLIGRNAASTTADYILQVASGEFLARPYVLMLSELRRRHPDEPLDGILARHPIESRDLFYDYLGSEETLLDRAITDSQMAEMMMTGGRVVVPSYEIADATAYPGTLFADLLGLPEDHEYRQTVEKGSGFVRTGMQGTAMIGGAGALLYAMMRDPFDAINVLTKGTGQILKATKDSRAAQRMTTASTAAGNAMEASVLDGIPIAAERMAKDEAFKEVFEGVTRDTPAKDIVKNVMGKTVTIDDEEVSVLALLLNEAKNDEVAHGLGAAHLAIQSEAIEATVGARVNNTVPAYGVADSTVQMQRNAKKKIVEALESNERILDEVEYDLSRRQAFDTAQTEHAKAAFDAGDARRKLDVLNRKIASLEAKGMASQRVTLLAKAFAGDRDKAREALLTALGRFGKRGEDASVDAYRMLSILLAADQTLQGKTIINVVKRLKAGTPEEAAFADDVLDKFFSSYGAAGDKASDALKIAATERLAQEIASLKSRRDVLRATADEANARLVTTRKALDKAIAAIEEIAPARAERQIAAAKKTGRRPPQKIEADDGTVTYRPADPVPRKVKDASGVEKMRTDKPLRERLASNADEIEATVQMGKKAQQSRLKKLSQRAKAMPRKKATKKLEARKERLTTEQARQENFRAAVEANIRSIEANFADRLLGLIDVLNARRVLRNEGGPLGNFVEVGKILDNYERGLYDDKSLATVLRGSRQQGSARVQQQFDALWEAIGENPSLLETGDDDLAFESLQTFMNANRLWFDPKSAVGRQKLPFEKALELLPDGLRLEFFFSAAAALLDPVNRQFGTARVLRALQEASTRALPGASTVPRTLESMYEKQRRREAIIEADVINIEKAVQVYATRVDITTDEALDLAVKARTAYVTRDFEALAGNKEGFEALKEIFEVVGEGAARGARTRGIGEQAGFVLRFVAGDTSQPVQMLNSSSSIMDDMTDHLAAMHSMWKDRLQYLELGTVTDQQVGQVIVTLVRSQMRDSAAPEYVSNVIRAFMRNLTSLDVRSDILFTGTGPQRYERLKELLHAAEQIDEKTGKVMEGSLLGAVPAARAQRNREEGVSLLRDETNFLKVLDKSSPAIRAMRDIARAQLGVTAADAAQVVETLSRGAQDYKQGATDLSKELFMLRGLGQNVAQGSHVYIYDDLVAAHKFRGAYVPTRVQRVSPETGEFVGGRAARRTSAVTPPEISVEQVYGKGRLTRVTDPRFSGAPRYEVLKVAEDGTVSIRNTVTGATQDIAREALRTVPPPLNAVHTLEALNRMGVQRVSVEELASALQRLCLMASDSSDVPVWLTRAQLENVNRTLVQAQSTFDKIVQKDAVEMFTREYGASVLKGLVRQVMGAVSAIILYGYSLTGFITRPSRGVIAMIEDQMSGTQVRGLRAGVGLGLVGLKTLGRNISSGRLLSPSLGLGLGLNRLAIKSAEVAYKGVTSGTAAMHRAFGFRIPTDAQMLFDGPLQHLERSDPTAVFEYGGKQLRKADGTVMTNGEVFDELVEAGVYDTFHSQVRDAFFTESIQKIRQGTRVNYETARSATAARTYQAISERSQQLSAVVNEIGTEQRTWLYLDARVRGATRDEAHDILNMTLLNWTTPSILSGSLINGLVLYQRAKYQAVKQATRVWLRALGGDTDAIRPFMQYLRLKERVVPYVAEAYFGSDAPADPEARAEYMAAMSLLQAYEADWQEPRVYLTSRPFSQEEKLLLQALTPGQRYVGENYRYRARGQYEELMGFFMIADGILSAVTGNPGPRPDIPAFIMDNLNPIAGAFTQLGDSRRDGARYTRPGEESYAKALAKFGLVKLDYGEQRKLVREDVEAFKVGPGPISERIPYVVPTFGSLAYTEGYILYSKARELANWWDFVAGTSSGLVANEGIATTLDIFAGPEVGDLYRTERRLTSQEEMTAINVGKALRQRVLADAAQGGDLDGSSLITVDEITKAITARLLADAQMAGVLKQDLVREDELYYNVQQVVQATLDAAVEKEVESARRARIEADRQEALDQLDAKQ